MDNIDLRLMRAVQDGLPLSHEPFLAIASSIGISASEAIDRLRNLLETGYIKRIGGIFNSRRLGYCGTLCGMRVPDERVEEVAEILNAYPGITHNYLREDDSYNMWFTLQTMGRDELDSVLLKIIEESNISEFISLPSLESYKIQVKFEMNDAGAPGGFNDSI